MRIHLLLALILLRQFDLIAQPPVISIDSTKKDSFAFFNSLPTKCDFVLIYSEESYWRSNTENYKLLILSNSQWTAWTYFRKWKRSSDVYNNKGLKMKKYFHKNGKLDSLVTKQLFDSLATLDFWALQKDSLNETRGAQIYDLVNYKF